MTIESDVDLGSDANPVLIVATGNVRLGAASVNIVGLLYSQAADWDNGGPGDVKVQGAAVAEGNFIGRDIGGGAHGSSTTRSHPEAAAAEHGFVRARARQLEGFPMRRAAHAGGRRTPASRRSAASPSSKPSWPWP